MREPFYKARNYLNTFLMLQVLLGIAIIALAAISQQMLGSFLATTERKVLSSQFINAYTLGIQLVVTYLCSVTMWRRIWVRRCTPNVRLLLNVWLFFCFLIVICGFGNMWTLLTSGEAVEATVEAALRKGIDLYYSCPEWKLLWDSLQYNNECCGVHGYRDWMAAKWMPPETTPDPCDMKPSTVMAPYACCKHNCDSCYQNYVPGGNNKIPDLNLTQINTCGCMPIFTTYMWKMLYWLLALILIAFKIDIIICGFTKYIVSKQNDSEDPCNNTGFTDDEGRPLVVVKCPPNVRCVSFDDDDSSNCQCCCGQTACSSCGGVSDPGKNKDQMKSRESRFLH